MTSPTSKLRALSRLCVALGVAAIASVNAPRLVDAQGLVQGVQQGAKEGSKAAGPVGGVLGGAIGGVVGGFTGVLGVGQKGQSPGASGTKQAGSGKTARAVKAGKGTKQAVLTQDDQPQLSAEQIVADSDANIDRIKA